MSVTTATQQAACSSAELIGWQPLLGYSRALVSGVIICAKRIHWRVHFQSSILLLQTYLIQPKSLGPDNIVITLNLHEVLGGYLATGKVALLFCGPIKQFHVLITALHCTFSFYCCDENTMTTRKVGRKAYSLSYSIQGKRQEPVQRP